MPASVLVDALALRPAGAGAVLMFQEFPPGVVLTVESGPAPAAPGGWAAWEAAALADIDPLDEGGGWVPDVGPTAGPDRGMTPFDLAVADLLRAARDSAASAWIMTLVRLVPAPAVVALADLLRECRRGDR
jgi:hypothetical protein